MTEQDQDPELQALRAEFVGSFAERIDAIKAAITGSLDDESLQFQAHKLAGIAATYGFPTLTRIGELIDDYMDAGGEEGLAEFGALLCDALREALASGEDPSSCQADPRMQKLTSVAGSLPFGSMP